MSLYCMCEANNGKPDNQAFLAPNRYCAVPNALGEEPESLDVPPLALRRPMECIKTGTAQVILDDPQPNDWTGPRPHRWRRHYPNVDFFECPHCHARVAKG